MATALTNESKASTQPLDADGIITSDIYGSRPVLPNEAQINTHDNSSEISNLSSFEEPTHPDGRRDLNILPKINYIEQDRNSYCQDAIHDLPENVEEQFSQVHLHCAEYSTSSEIQLKDNALYNSQPITEIPSNLPGNTLDENSSPLHPHLDEASTVNILSLRHQRTNFQDIPCSTVNQQPSNQAAGENPLCDISLVASPSAVPCNSQTHYQPTCAISHSLEFISSSLMPKEALDPLLPASTNIDISSISLSGLSLIGSNTFDDSTLTINTPLPSGVLIPDSMSTMEPGYLNFSHDPLQPVVQSGSIQCATEIQAFSAPSTDIESYLDAESTFWRSVVIPPSLDLSHFQLNLSPDTSQPHKYVTPSRYMTPEEHLKDLFSKTTMETTGRYAQLLQDYQNYRNKPSDQAFLTQRLHGVEQESQRIREEMIQLRERNSKLQRELLATQQLLKRAQSAVISYYEQAKHWEKYALSLGSNRSDSSIVEPSEEDSDFE